MSPQIVNPEGLAPPRGYSHGIRMTGDSVLFVAGQVAWDGDGRLVGEGDFPAQFEKALENVVAVVREAGGTPECIGKLTIFVKDRDQYLATLKQVGEGYRRQMGRHFPAMTLVQVAELLEPGVLVEIEGYACV